MAFRRTSPSRTSKQGTQSTVPSYLGLRKFKAFLFPQHVLLAFGVVLLLCIHRKALGVNPVCTFAFAGERKSKRSRKGRSVVNVACTTQLSMLRNLVSQPLGLHPGNCALYVCTAGRWALLEGDDASLRGVPLASTQVF